MTTKKIGRIRLCSVMLILAMVFGFCGVFAMPAQAAETMTPIKSFNPDEEGTTVDIKVRNITGDEKNNYVLLFGNGNEFRVDGTNSATQSPDAYKGVVGSLDQSMPVLKKTLGADGYPQLAKNDRQLNEEQMIDKYDSISLASIFDGGKAYTATNTPFKKVGTHNYSYDSAKNHTYFKAGSGKTGEFILYNEPLRPFDITTSYGYAEFGAFLPFNDGTNVIKLTDGSGNKINNESTKDAAWNEAADADPAANMYVTPHEGTNQADNWFAMSIEFSFYIPKDGQIDGKDMVFEFSGDDDVWVYVDDVLVVDQGGTHKHTGSYINFHTGEVSYQKYDENAKVTDGMTEDQIAAAKWPWVKTTIKDSFIAAANETKDSKYSDASQFDGNTFEDYTVHTLTFFFMERGGEASNCKLDFNLPVIPKGALSVQKTLNGVVTKEAENQQYTFILKDKDGNALSNTEYSVIKTDGTLGSGTTSDNGQFKLKANERAVFEKIEGGTNYSVLQITEKDDEVYNDYSSDTTCTINGVAKGSEGTDGYSTGSFEVKYDKDNQTNIVFTNTMLQNKTLTVTKEIGNYISIDQTFSFSATVEGFASPVTFNLKGDESYTIEGIPAGADVTITETVPDSMEATSSVKGTTTTGTNVINVNDITAAETEVNYLNEIKLYDLTVNKIIDGSLGNKSKEFDFTVSVVFGDYSDDVVKTHTFDLSNNGTWTLEDIPYGANVTVSEDEEDYTATRIVGDARTENTNSWTIDEITADKEVTFENVKDGAPNTGISLDSLPYIVLLILVIAGGAAFVVRRRKIDCEL